MARIAPLPVARQAALSVAKGFDTLLRLGWVPVLISSVAGMVLEPAALTVMPGEEQIELHFGPLIALLVIGIATQTIFAVAWHRSVALGETHAGRRFYLRFGKREAVYGVVAIIFASILSMGMGALPVVSSLLAGGQLIGALVVLAAPLMSLFLVARLGLLLPMVALGQAVDPARAWQAVHGNTWRVAAVLLAVGVPVGIALLLLLTVFGGVVENAVTELGAMGQAISFVARFVSGLVVMALFGVIISALTLLYMILAGDDTLKARLPAPYESFVETPRD